MSIGRDIKQLKKIVSEERTEGKERLALGGINVKGNTVEDVVDNIPINAGIAFSQVRFTGNSALNDILTSASR